MDKTKVIAVTVIHRTIKPGVRGDKSKGIAPIKPEVQIIKPGTIFQTRDRDEFNELMSAGAIRLPEKNEKVMVGIESVATDEDEAPARKSAAKPARAKSGGRKAVTKPVETGSDKGDGTDGNDLV